MFSFDPSTGEEKVLYAFCKLDSCADGSKPFGDVINVNGLLYGTTFAGGQIGNDCNDMGLGCGTVFALDPTSGVETVLHAFGGGKDGSVPGAGLINVNGMLYGTTQTGGGYSDCSFEDGLGCGTVFSIDLTSGAETIVHSFRENGKDGLYPTADLMEMKGKLYGTTRGGGAHGYGTVYSIDLGSSREKIVYAFCSQQREWDDLFDHAVSHSEGPYGPRTATVS